MTHARRSVINIITETVIKAAARLFLFVRSVSQNHYLLMIRALTGVIGLLLVGWLSRRRLFAFGVLINRVVIKKKKQ